MWNFIGDFSSTFAASTDTRYDHASTYFNSRLEKQMQKLLLKLSLKKCQCAFISLYLKTWVHACENLPLKGRVWSRRRHGKGFLKGWAWFPLWLHFSFPNSLLLLPRCPPTLHLPPPPPRAAFCWCSWRRRSWKVWPPRRRRWAWKKEREWEWEVRLAHRMGESSVTEDWRTGRPTGCRFNRRLRYPLSFP